MDYPIFCCLWSVLCSPQLRIVDGLNLCKRSGCSVCVLALVRRVFFCLAHSQLLASEPCDLSSVHTACYLSWLFLWCLNVTFSYSHTSSSMKQSEASVLTVADLADLFTEETEELEWRHRLMKSESTLYNNVLYIILTCYSFKHYLITALKRATGCR